MTCLKCPWIQCFQGIIRFWLDFPQEKLLALKELCRNRAYLMDMASDLKRKIVAILDRVFPEYETLFDSVFCKTSLAVLTKYPTPDKLSRAQLGKLTEVLQKSSNGRFGEWKAREIKELARGSFGVADCEGVYGWTASRWRSATAARSS